MSRPLGRARIDWDKLWADDPEPFHHDCHLFADFPDLQCDECASAPPVRQAQSAVSAPVRHTRAHGALHSHESNKITDGALLDEGATA